jgi:NADPH:quinone reductase-like Zn-dependent oxidoreductase
MIATITRPDQIWIPLTLGMIRKEWERFPLSGKTDDSLYTNNPETGGLTGIATEDDWDNCFKTSKFSGNDLIIRDFQGALCHSVSLLISHRVDTADLVNDEDDQICVIVDETSPRQLQLTNLIRESLGQEILVKDFTDTTVKKVTGTETIIFLPELDRSVLQGPSNEEYQRLKRLLQNTKYLMWVASAISNTPPHPTSALMQGFTRVLRSEVLARKIISVTIEGEDCSIEVANLLRKILIQTQSSKYPQEDVEFMIRDGKAMVGRISEHKQVEKSVQAMIRPTTRRERWQHGPPTVLSMDTTGSLDTLRYTIDSEYPAQLSSNDIEIEAKSWGLNFRDILVALGRLDEKTFGFEASGVVTRVGQNVSEFAPGDRVCLTSIGCFRKYARGDRSLATKLPAHVSFETAAAAAGVGITAYHALIKVARLRKGEKVLIHSAAGGTGQMGVRVAQMVGAEVFATVGYDTKKELLIEHCGVPEDHIFYSRNTNFAQAIKRATNGYGVDVVLNSLSGDSLVASWEILAAHGRFIEIGKADILGNSSLPMSKFAKNCSFAAVDFVHLAQSAPHIVQESMVEFMELIGNGTIRCPFPVHSYSVSQVEEAFRLMQSGSNSGRIVINSQPMDMVTVRKRHTPSSSYIVLMLYSETYM